MSHLRFTADEIAERGKALYAQQISPRIEEDNRGNYLVINIETGEYEIDSDRLTASDKAAAKYPGAALFAMRVGYPTLGRLGARRSVRSA